jgi:hypothetical protein
MCKNFAVYGRCMFAERCSYLHYSFNRGEQTATSGDKAIEQNVFELKDEVNTLRIEVDRLGKHLLEMIKNLKEESKEVRK